MLSKFVIKKSGQLKGKIKVGGAKNSVLALLPATLLNSEVCIIDEVPNLKDVSVMTDLLREIGAKVEYIDSEKIQIQANCLKSHEASYELVEQMRASFYVMGPLLTRFGIARVAKPGGCAIGTRPIDLHLKGFAALGAEIDETLEYVEARCEGRLKGAKIYLDYPSVGATANIMMAATLAEGMTHIENAAEEPEIIDLANFLNKMGASIKGAGTDTIRINGVESLYSAEHVAIPDRIETGTYMVAAAITGGDLLIENVMPSHLKPITAKLRECNVEVEEYEDSIRVIGSNEIVSVDVTTLPYPGFPTDMQAQFMALMTCANGVSDINETVFENRFMHVAELNKMGADIEIQGHSAIVKGIDKLKGAKVRATDLRAGVALVLAGLVAEETTEVLDIRHIDRGYVRIEDKLNAVGANIQRVED